MMNPRPTPPTKATRRRKPLPQRGEGRKGRPPQQGRPKGPRREKLFPRTAGLYAALERHYVAKRKNLEVIRESGYLQSRQGLGPWRPVLVVVTGVGRAVRGKSFSLLGPFGLPRWGGLPFPPSLRWGRGFLLLFLTFVRGVGIG